MSPTPDQIDTQLDALRARLVDQGRLVTDISEQAFQAIFDMDADHALEIMTRDDEVDKADLEIERDAVDLLHAAANNTGGVTHTQVRGVLTCVKVNNELERIADAATSVAHRVVSLGSRTPNFPKTTRVMTNSVVSIIRDTVRGFERRDAEIAKTVLSAEGAVLEFYDRIVEKAEARIADGRLDVEPAFELHTIVHQAVIMADHCTNIAEQVIYETTGAVVRHTGSGWVEHDPRAG